MTPRRKLTLIVGIATAGAVCGLLLLHSSVVQRPLIKAISDSIEAGTGWVVEIENPRLRLWPARFVAEGVTVSTGGQVIGSIERLEARWSWIAVMGSPRRIDDVSIQGLEIDLRQPLQTPAATAAADEVPLDPWRVLEIGRLQVTDGRGAARVLDILGQIDDLRTEVTLVDGIVDVNLTAQRLKLDRLDRRLELGPVVLRARASAEGVMVDDLELGQGDLALRGHGKFSPADGGSGSASFRIRSELEGALAWWDPNLVSGLDPSDLPPSSARHRLGGNCNSGTER